MVKKRVLVVDDEPDIVETIKFRLVNAGFEVITAGDGEEALKKVREENPDLVLLDILLPKKDGYAVCQEIKSNPSLETIPVIMVTIKGEKEDKFRALIDIGANGYITKPFDSDKLVQQVKEILSRKE